MFTHKPSTYSANASQCVRLLFACITASIPPHRTLFQLNRETFGWEKGMAHKWNSISLYRAVRAKAEM